MGGAVSTGEDNDDLVNNLVEAEYIKTPLVEKVFRAVDRADYYLPEYRDNAYKDLAWKHGHLHLSAPCIYSEVMESLQLEPGLSFLNLGSGTGYLSTMVGLILGPYGINHGIELHEDVVKYARDRVEEFKRNSAMFDEFEFSEPKFVSGNCLLLNSGIRLYDRVYCGAACPVEHENYMKNLISVGGVLVMPLNDQLLQIRRVDETEWETKNVLPVSFASLVVPSKDSTNEVVELAEVGLPPLQDVSRIAIRRTLRANIFKERPYLKNVHKHKKKQRRQKKHINIVPMNMGMMIMGHFEGSDEEEQTDGQESDKDSQNEDDDSSQSSCETMEISSLKRQTNGKNGNDKAASTAAKQVMDSEVSSTLGKRIKSLISQTRLHTAVAECRSNEENEVVDMSSDESDDEGLNFKVTEILDASSFEMCRNKRCSSSTSAETSETSGIGTLSDHSDADSGKDQNDKISPSGDSASWSQAIDCKDKKEPKESFKLYMKQKIDELPLPLALKSYLMYYRI